MHRDALLPAWMLVGLLALPSACLRIPPAPDGSTLGDQAATAPFGVLGWHVVDQRGQTWPTDAAPRWPVVRIQMSEPPNSDAEGEVPVWLFVGQGDEDLREDLDRAPLRVATRARVVPSDVGREGSEWVISPHQRLRPRQTYAVGVGAWAVAADLDERLGTAWLKELTVSDAPEAGAEVVGSWPADGAAAVAPSIHELGLRFDGPVTGWREGIGLWEETRRVAAEVRSSPCEELGWVAGWCVRLSPTSELAPGRPHRLRVEATVVDAAGAPVGPWEARFVSAPVPDTEPPRLSALACALDEVELPFACLFTDDASFELRIRASEPVRARLTVGDRELTTIAPRGEAGLSAGGFPSGVAFDAVLRVEDTAGRTTVEEFVLEILPPLATVSIVEVRADPRGPEPRQEYVEVLNWGTVTVDLDGFALSDRVDTRGDSVPRTARLAPGQRALLVADGFDPEDPADPPVPPGVPLVRLDRSIGSGGLTNAGEPLFLRDRNDYRLSAAPALRAAEGQCIIRRGPEMRGGAVEHFTTGPCTPGTEPAGDP